MAVPYSRQAEALLLELRQERLETDRRAFDTFIRKRPKPTGSELLAALRWFCLNPRHSSPERLHLLCTLQSIANELSASLKLNHQDDPE